MSVLNQSGEEQVECPLCMEPLEVDDLNFYPCTCGYQICRFCWHRIRTDENGLCPACRKAYSENPADFIPLSQEQVAKLKAEKRQRDQQRKAKLTESRKHLASVRVVQRNLVFVVGLPMRLADPEVLKRHEYFGKFGKIHKVVINQSTAYAGTQGPSASAYVTYMKSDDALRAIQSVNNITIDGRLIKSSLGTTKYCSHFMKNQTCPKPDCMYLHDFGDPEASFTKEQMHACKHQEYEKKLHENLVQKMVNSNSCSQHSSENGKQSVPIPTGGDGSKSSSKENIASLSSSVGSTASTGSGGGTNKENWPHLSANEKEKEKEKKEKGKKSKTKSGGQEGGNRKERRDVAKSEKSSYKTEVKESKPTSPTPPSDPTPTTPPPPLSRPEEAPPRSAPPIRTLMAGPASLTGGDDNTSFFSSSTNSFRRVAPGGGREEPAEAEHDGHALLSDSFPSISTTEDWAAAFGFPKHVDSLGSETGGVSKEERINLDILAIRFGQLGYNGFSKGVKKEDKLMNIDSLNSGFGQLGPNGFSKVDTYNNGFYEADKLQENLMDMLSGGSSSTFKHPPPPLPAQQKPPSPPHSCLNGLDQNMSKFFMDFHKNKEQQQQQQQYSDGFGGHAYYSDLHSEAERVKMLQQRQLEARLMNIASFKQNYQNNTGNPYQNGMNQQLYMNGENGGFGNYHSQIYGSSNVKQNTEDDLGFDPFQETQKAFAELMASEQNHQTHNTGHSQINSMIHNQNSGLVPPPPPGFVPQNPSTHMNSFGSKILPFLNMPNSQQQVNSQSPSNNWPSNFNSHLQQQQQQPKNMSNTCNDWKVLDPAILSSSRHYPIANMSQNNREHYPNISQIGTQQQIQNGPPLRYEFTNNAFSNFTQQLQPNFNNMSHLNSQQNLNWFGSDINSQITSPPGFRNNQATKQQEC